MRVEVGILLAMAFLYKSVAEAEAAIQPAAPYGEPAGFRGRARRVVILLSNDSPVPLRFVKAEFSSGEAVVPPPQEIPPHHTATLYMASTARSFFRGVTGVATYFGRGLESSFRVTITFNSPYVGKYASYAHIDHFPVPSSRQDDDDFLHAMYENLGPVLADYTNLYHPHGGSSVLAGPMGATWQLRYSPADEVQKFELSRVTDLPPVVGSTTFKVLLYNVFLRPIIVSHDGQDERARRIPDAIAKAVGEVDVIVLNEAFTHQDELARLFARNGYVFATKTMWSYGSLTNSGVLIFSRCRIVSSKYHVFATGSTSGTDALAAKGVVYVHAMKGSKSVHILATHLQAWDYDGAVRARRRQLQLMRNFISSLDIPPTDPLLFVGDLNVNYRVREDLEGMLSLLRASLPRRIGEVTQSADNDLAGRDGGTYPNGGEWLDYVLISKDHQQPSGEAVLAVVPEVKSDFPFSVQWSALGASKEIRDLSDHFPVLFDMTVDTFQPEVTAVPKPADTNLYKPVDPKEEELARHDDL